MKKLFKSKTDKKICGICGGLGKFFDIDSTFVRLGFAAAAVLWGSGIFLYIVLALITPYEQEDAE